jgi:hypothetical protein
VKKNLSIFCLLLVFVTLQVSNIFGQPAITDSTEKKFTPHGTLWGYVFGDYYYKAHSDPLNRGGSNQYSNIEKDRNAFQLRRVYLGYNYDITPKFAAELLLAAEDNVTNANGVTSGDLLSDNKFSFYIKLANIRWKNIWKGTDLVVGQAATPAYPLLIDPIWRYRSVERTIIDIRRTPSADLGAALQGKFDPETGNYGYNIMVGNGTGARPENDKFKWFYSDIWAKFFKKKLVLDLYADYQRLNWTSSFHHSRQMLKGFAAYTTPVFTVGIEAFFNNGKNDVAGIRGTSFDTLNAKAKGISVFTHGDIVKNKLRFFARLDSYNPNTEYNNSLYTSYKGFTPAYEPNNKETFITGGLDFMPVKNVHFMPNIWYNRYKPQQANITGTGNNEYDLVYRLTVYWIFRPDK